MSDYLFQGLELLFKENINKETPCTLTECLGLKVKDFMSFSRPYVGIVFPISSDSSYFESYYDIDESAWNFVLANLDMVKCAAETIDRDSDAISCYQMKLLERSCQAIVRLGIEAYLMKDCIPKSSSQIKNEVLMMPRNVAEWNERDNRLFIVVQAMFYILELANQRIVSPGPYRVLNTLRERDPTSVGRNFGLIERVTPSSSGAESSTVVREEPTFDEAEFGLRPVDNKSEVKGHTKVDLVDKKCVESALQTFADNIMDDCFLSMFVAINHLKRNNKLIEKQPEMKKQMLARITWCTSNLSKFARMRCLGLIFIDLVMLQAFIESKKSEAPAKFTKRKWLRAASIEILSECLLSSSKGLTVAIRSLMSTEHLTDYDEQEKCEHVAIIIMTIIRSYLHKDHLIELFNQLSSLLHCGAMFLRQTSASIIIRLLEYDDTLSILIKNLIFKDSISRLNKCRDIPSGIENNITYALETFYYIFCKRGQAIYKESLIIEMLEPLVDILFHISTHIRISSWKKRIISLVGKYISTLDLNDALSKILSLACLEFQNKQDRDFASQIYRIIVKEEPSYRKTYQDQINGHDIIVAMKIELLEFNGNLKTNEATIISICRCTLDMLSEIKKKNLNADIFIYLFNELNTILDSKGNHPYHNLIVCKLLDSILMESSNSNELINEYIGKPKKIAFIAKETLQRADKLLKVANIDLPSHNSNRNENSLVIPITLLSCVLSDVKLRQDAEIFRIFVECVPYLGTISLIHPNEYTKDLATNLRMSITTCSMINNCDPKVITISNKDSISISLSKSSSSSSSSSSLTKKKTSAPHSTQKKITVLTSKSVNAAYKPHKSIIYNNHAIPDPTNMETYAEALILLADSSVPIKGHGIMCIIKLLGYRDHDAIKHIDDILNIFKDCLSHYDTFIHLQAINGLRSMAYLMPDRMMSEILDAISNTTLTITGQVMCRWAEVLMSISKEIGIEKYKKKLIRTLMFIIRHTEEDMVKCSTISVLIDIVKELNYHIDGFEEEIFLMIEANLQMEQDVIVTRSAAHFLSLLLRNANIDQFISMMDTLMSRVYKLLRLIMSKKGTDDIVKQHCEFAIDEINRHSRCLFQPEIKLEKTIRVLRI